MWFVVVWFKGCVLWCGCGGMGGVGVVERGCGVHVGLLVVVYVCWCVCRCDG